MSAAVVDDLVAASAELDPPGIERDRYGRPYVVRDGKRKSYTRVSKLAKALDNTWQLERWKVRMAMLGLVVRNDLYLRVAAAAPDAETRDGKEELNRLGDEAIEAAKGSTGANLGTALHKLCERIDRGEQLGPIPADFTGDLRAYERATAAFEVVAVERFVVLDDIQVAGSLDRIVRLDGCNYIADIKTGKTMEFGQAAMSMQLALYAHGMFYDPSTHERTPLPGVSGEHGIIIHLPAGQGRAALHWIDLRPGWEMVPTALAAKAWQGRKSLMTPLNVEAAENNLADAGLIDDPITARILAANSVPELNAIWAEFAETGWKAEHTQQAAARKAALTEGVPA